MNDHSPLLARASLVAMTLGLAFGSLSYAQEAPLTLDEALRLAAERSQQLVAQDAAASAAREAAIAAAERPDPVLTAGLDNLPVNGPDDFSLTRDFMTMRNIGIGRELVGDRKRAARVTRFEREVGAAQAGRDLALATLQQQTAAAWLDRHFRERSLELLAERRTEADSLVTAAELDYRNGTGTQSDVLAAHSARAYIDDAIAIAERNATLAVVRLERWIGAAAARPLAGLPAIDSIALHHSDLEAQLAQHPDIQMMIKREEVAAAAAEIARTERRPNWTVAVAYGERGPAYSDMISLSASRPLQLRKPYRQDRELAATLALVAQARAEREEETRMHLAATRTLLETWSSNRERLARFASTLVPLARERTSAATSAYRTRTGTFTDVLAARSAAIDTELEQLDLEAATAAIWAELEYLIPAEHAGH